MMRQDWVGTYLHTSLGSWFDAPDDEQGLFVGLLDLALSLQRPGRRRRRMGEAAGAGSCVMILIILVEPSAFTSLGLSR